MWLSLIDLCYGPQTKVAGAAKNSVFEFGRHFNADGGILPPADTVAGLAENRNAHAVRS